MGKLLWIPSEERRKQANATRFTAFVNDRYGLTIDSYASLHRWSVERIPEFWSAVWDFVQIRSSHPYDQVVDDLARFPGAKWFAGARLNFAENLLHHRDDRIAFSFHGESQKSATITYSALHRAVARLASSLRQSGVRPGDRVVGYMPNLIETAATMLATTAIGAVWSSCATDMGPQAVVDRLGQIEPKVLFTVDGYFYKGKAFDSLGNVAEIVRGIPTLKKTVVVGYLGPKPDIARIHEAVHYDEFSRYVESPELEFEQLPFDHPALIMFSSGTTGKPKCLVQSGGGVLINHLKELVLHTDLRPQDTICYITTCSWMMWNWVLSSLATGARIVLYDGNPAFPGPEALWRLVQDEQITVFGTSASYINAIRSQRLTPGRSYDLSSLREVLQTGSALSADGFEYVYSAVKNDLHFNSISGGTDINGCFAAGTPTIPVYAGQVQAPALGMKVNCYDEAGRPVRDQRGELVCEAPSPSMPLYFWNDPDGRKYREAYFSVYPNIWRHGDYVVMHSDTGGITFHGRSDAVLKPSGVRIGTAEIYNVVEMLPELSDSLAIGQDWQGDQRIILFVKMAEGCRLTDELKKKIAGTLREHASPRHVPAVIFEAPDIPYTLNMKKVESAVTNIVHGRPVSNRDALANPECLDYFEQLSKSLQE